MVIVLEAKAADTPAGSPVAAPIPVAPVVVCVIGVRAVPTQRVGVDDGILTVFVVITVMVPVAFTVPHPPVKGIE